MALHVAAVALLVVGCYFAPFREDAMRHYTEPVRVEAIQSDI